MKNQSAKPVRFFQKMNSLWISAIFSSFLETTPVSRYCFSLFQNELCVCAIADLLSMTQSAISHQLKTLLKNNLVGNRREGKTVYYFLADDHVRTIIGQGFDHLKETEK